MNQLQTVREFVVLSHDHEFWRDITVDELQHSQNRDEYYVHLRGVVTGQTLAAMRAGRWAELLEQMRPRHYREVLDKMSRQRWIGPYRWRK